MKYYIFFFALLSSSINSYSQSEYKYLENKTYTYDEAHEIYNKMAEKYEEANIEIMGESDIGKPIKLFVISSNKDFDFKSEQNKNKGVLLINNAIHPGEPCGVDASIKLAKDLLSNKSYKNLLKNTIICIVPFYNVGGGLNRSCCSRANQNGPEEYGFRGNAQNRDLNRDFIKCDTKNAEAFTKLFHLCNPDVFIDAHTTNGADFQYAMSLIATQPDKLTPQLRGYLRKDMLPYLYTDMEKKNKEIIPYVYSYKGNLENGIKDYLETPRYSTGYTTLFNTIGFVTEALKYKSYTQRVEHTYEFFISTLNWMNENNIELKSVRNKAIEEIKTQTNFELAWKLDTTIFKKINFKGYETEQHKSSFGEGSTYLIYNHDKKYTKEINYYYKFKPTVVVKKPIAYIVPQAYSKVIDRLKWNKIEMKRLERDTVINVEMYYVKDYKTVKNPYEGHYLHYGVLVDKEEMEVKYFKGDYVIYTNQSSNRYIIETLEPQGMDSFFAWNFFDGILQQKEWFSSFSFEETAKEMLLWMPVLKSDFERKKKEEPEFAKSRNQQLLYIYKRSNHYENTHNRYPVGRIVK
ncbi:MAG: hypothetical protein COB15_12710 [Flavobacteriales bacterium]|nr:MAG: hypothetical protein COB15_12710 [Flavobacteriales bacterium]